MTTLTINDEEGGLHSVTDFDAGLVLLFTTKRKTKLKISRGWG